MRTWNFSIIILILLSLNGFSQGSTIIYTTDFNPTNPNTPSDTLGWGELTNYFSDTAAATVQTGWYLGNWPTPTKGTGPDVAQSGDYFAYFEHSCGFPACSDTNYAMTSPEILLNGTGSKLAFWYLLFGKKRSNRDTIPSVLTVSILSGPSMTIKDTIFGPLDNGQQTDGLFSSWQKADTIDISKYDGQVVRIEFMGTKGSTFLQSMGDIGIDNLSVTVNTPHNPIPALGEWSYAIFSLLLLIVGINFMRQNCYVESVE